MEGPPESKAGALPPGVHIPEETKAGDTVAPAVVAGH